jgi:hypothetical protein
MMATSKQTVLPPINADLDPPHRRVAFKDLKPRSEISDAEVDANSHELAGKWGASTSRHADTVTSPAASVVPVTASLRLEIPGYLDAELALRAVNERVTKQYLVLQSLKAAGYKLNDGDLVGDKRRARRKA